MATQEQSLARLLAATYQSFTADLASRLASGGWTDISLAHGKVLERIGAYGVRVRGLADELAVSHQAATQLVDHLERSGYLKRRQDPKDARAKVVSLTKRGERYVDEALAHITAIESEWSIIIGTRSVAQLKESLTTLARPCA
jgi:DNA-binding MarR family transcriptional regulator